MNNNCKHQFIEQLYFKSYMGYSCHYLFIKIVLEEHIYKYNFSQDLTFSLV